jgi:ABC-2 type transport system ATP-binding protein
MNRPDVALAASELVKTYPQPGGGQLRAVDGLSFEVARGEIFAVVGPNGAGKTTTLEIAEGLSEPTSGTVEVLGMDLARHRDRVKQRIGVQLQSSSYFEHLTLEEILVLFGSFYDRRLAPAPLLDLVGLAERRRALVGQLSGGQAQRFSIVAAMVNDPDLVFLDEPTTGLDPQSRRNLWDLIRAINADHDKTVVLTTHYMEEAEVLADRVAIVDHGRLVALDTPAALIGSLPQQHRLRFTLPHPVRADELRALPGVSVVQPRLNGHATYEVASASPQDTVPALFTWAATRHVDLRDIRIDAPTLEDVFLARTGTSLRD